MELRRVALGVASRDETFVPEMHLDARPIDVGAGEATRGSQTCAASGEADACGPALGLTSLGEYLRDRGRGGSGELVDIGVNKRLRIGEVRGIEA